MSKLIAVSDTRYQALQEAAARQNESVAGFVTRITNALAQAQNPVYFTIEEMFDALDAYAESV